MKKYVGTEWMLELADAVRKAYRRVSTLGAQEREEFQNWVKYILLSVCGIRRQWWRIS